MKDSRKKFHHGVLQTEVLKALNVFPKEIYLDCTFGGGTHAEKILQLKARVIGLDVDKEAIENAVAKFGLFERDGVWVTKDNNLKIYRENFANLDQVLQKENLEKVSGVLFDLGVSSHQLDSYERGFSFSKESPLDMRLDQRLAITAKELLKVLNERELYELFSKLGGERNARSIARNIVRYRNHKAIETTGDLVAIIGEKRFGVDRIHPATRVFMALRIAVNDELNALKIALPKALKSLKVGGRLVVISFHSLEDKIVKDFFKKSTSLKVLTEKPIEASESERKENPRSRSAKLRVAEKI